MLKNKSSRAVHLERELGKNAQTKAYLEHITGSFERAKAAKMVLDPQSVYNSYFSAIMKCTQSLIQRGIVRQLNVNRYDIDELAKKYAENMLK